MPKKLITEEFVQRARAVHGDKYDYSKVIYTGNKNKVIIICPEHGEFLQKSEKHLIGQGCIKCGFLKTAIAQKSNTEDFIKKAKVIHGDKYNYSKTEYKKSTENVIIICPIHGEIQQMAGVHLMGSGCPKCDGKGKTTEEFIGEAKVKHGDKYDYSKVNYINSSTKVIIGCPIHGDFLQTPTGHLHNSGCQKCGGNMKLTLNEFIERAKAVHGDKYDYSLVKYKNIDERVWIICPEHGKWQQTPNSHLHGNGCPICARNRLGEGQRLTHEQFIEKAKVKHGDKYDYSKVNYVNNNTKVIIRCLIHGDFEQIPASHFIGTGCPKCGGRGFTYLPFEEARQFVHNLNFKSQEEYNEWWDKNKPEFLPKNPYQYYNK
jgi:hypothetical protein